MGVRLSRLIGPLIGLDTKENLKIKKKRESGPRTPIYMPVRLRSVSTPVLWRRLSEYPMKAMRRHN
jgi:hypothetical protein